MKTLQKFMIAFGLSALIVSTTNAQNISASKVPAVVKAVFNNEHPGIKANWEIEEGNYEAGYTSKGLENSFFIPRWAK